MLLASELAGVELSANHYSVRWRCGPLFAPSSICHLSCVVMDGLQLRPDLAVRLLLRRHDRQNVQIGVVVVWD